ncbi:MAG: thioredoxin fold domain-containing protein [Rubrivivax sp.]
MLKARMLALTMVLAVLLPAAGAAPAQQPSPHAIAIPRWFSNSLLDFKDEVPEAARQGKRLMVYFGQDGCPYCKALMQHTFAPGPVQDKLRRHFTAVAVNIWGDAEATWVDGRAFTEKTLARELNVQFTPTLLFLGDDGRVRVRLNGYLPPERFEPVLDYLIAGRDRSESLADYLAARSTAAPLPPRPPAPYLLRDPAVLTRKAGGKSLAVLFESSACKACAEMHAEAFARPGLRRLLQRFDVARLLPGQPATLRLPDGRTSSAREWSRELGIMLHPTVVFFDDRAREVFRFDGYLRPFHIESAFDYVASGAYRTEPQFQRYVQARAERLRAAGQPVDLWR